MADNTGMRAKSNGEPKQVSPKGLRRYWPWKLAQGKRWWYPRSSTLIALVLMFGAAFLIQQQSPIAEAVQVKAFDVYQNIRPRQPLEGNPVVILDIDEASLASIGQWPWSRTIIAQIIDRLTEAGVVAIGFDVVFPEPDRLSPRVVAGSLPQIDSEVRAKLESLPSNDTVFAESIRRSGRVVLGKSGYIEEVQGGKTPAPAKSIAEIGEDPRPYITRFPSLIDNVPELTDAAKGSGLFSILPEFDGIVRRVPLVGMVDENIYPALTVEMLRVAAQVPTVALRTDNLGVQSLAIPGVTNIPTDARGRIWVHYTPHNRDHYIPAKDLLSGAYDASQLEGKLVLIGTSAVGLLDIRSTPLDAFIPGVEVHLNILESVMADELLTRPNYSSGIEALTIVVMGLLLIVLVPRLGALYTLLLVMGTLGAFAGISWYMYIDHKTLIDVSVPGISAIVIYFLLVFANYLRDEAEKQRVRGAFSRYMSPALVERLAENPAGLKLGGEMRDMTLLFSDIRGFTTISEAFSADPEGLTAFINRFLTPMTDIILSFRGTIDKYMGDAIMAFWNAPLTDEDHARNACKAALEMLSRVKTWNEEMQREAAAQGKQHYPIAIGVGLNTGQCCVGNMGSEQRFDYSVLGDTVNLASRMEGQSKTYGVQTVIGEGTLEKVPDFAALPLDNIRVKGKTRPVFIYTLLGDAAVANNQDFITLKTSHDAMMGAYRKAQFAEAKRLIVECRQLANGHWDLGALYDLYDDRIAHFESEPPPPDWDGVFTATSK